MLSGDEFPNEQRNGLVAFGHWYLKELQNRLETIPMNLTGDRIPIEYESLCNKLNNRYKKIFSFLRI